MENGDKNGRDRRRFERVLGEKGFHATGEKVGGADVWRSMVGGEVTEFHLDEIGFFHFISGRREIGGAWDRSGRYEF